MNKILIALVLVVGLSGNVFALEITKYTKDPVTVMEGVLFKTYHNHYITIALDDMDSRKIVRCTILENKKPIAKESAYIDGLGTMLISTNPTSNNSVSCKEIEEKKKSWWQR